MNELSNEAIFLIVLILILVFGGTSGSSRRSGGVHVKPRAKTPKPKVGPAPQAGAKKF